MELRQHWATLRRRAWLIVAVVAASIAGTWATGLLESPGPRYRATATLLVTTPPGQLVVYPVEAVRTVAVAREVVRATKVDADPDVVLDGLRIAPRQGTSLVDVMMENGDPAETARLANGFAHAYLARYARAAAADPRALSVLEQAHQRLRDEATSVAGSGLDPTRKEWELRWLQIRDETLARAYADVSMRRLPGAGADARLLDRATPPGRAVETTGREWAQALGGIALVALIGAFALAFLLESLDLRLRDEADVEEATGLPVLATLPSERRLRRAARRFRAMGRRPGDGDGVTAFPVIPDPRLAEAFQSLRLHIELVSNERPLRSILVASPWGGKAKTWVTAYLGTVFARAGARVVLVSADLHRPGLEALFDLPAAPGLGEAESDHTLGLTALLRRTWIQNLEIVPAGLCRAHPADVLASAPVERIFEAAHREADVVVVEAPPVLAGTEASLLLPSCDGILLVLRADRTTRHEAQAAKAALERLPGGAVFLGTVVTDVVEARTARRYNRARPGRRLGGLLPANHDSAGNGRVPANVGREGG